MRSSLKVFVSNSSICLSIRHPARFGLRVRHSSSPFSAALPFSRPCSFSAWASCSFSPSPRELGHHVNALISCRAKDVIICEIRTEWAPRSPNQDILFRGACSGNKGNAILEILLRLCPGEVIGMGNDLRLIIENTTRGVVAFKDSGKEAPTAATNIDDALRVGEVIGAGDNGFSASAPFAIPRSKRCCASG